MTAGEADHMTEQPEPRAWCLGSWAPPWGTAERRGVDPKKNKQLKWKENRFPSAHLEDGTRRIAQSLDCTQNWNRAESRIDLRWGAGVRLGYIKCAWMTGWNESDQISKPLSCLWRGLLLVRENIAWCACEFNTEPRLA